MNKYKLSVQNAFKKDLKKYKNNKHCLDAIFETIKLLQTGNSLPKKYKEHKLIGDYIGFLECHSKPDVLIIFNRDHEKKIIKLYRCGSHSNLFL